MATKGQCSGDRMQCGGIGGDDRVTMETAVTVTPVVRGDSGDSSDDSGDNAAT